MARPDPTSEAPVSAAAREATGRLPPGVEPAEVAAWFERLADMVDALVFVTEPGGKMLWTNRKFFEHTGRTLADFQFENPANPFLHPDDVGRVGQFFVDFLASPAPVSGPIENRFYDRWGQEQHYRSLIAKVQWQGRPACMLLTVPRTAAVSGALETSEARFRTLVDAAQDGIVTVGLDGGIRFANKHFLGWVGRDLVSLGRAKVWDLTGEEGRAATREGFEQASAVRAPVRLEVRLVAPDGQERRVDVSASYLEEPGHDGVYLAIVRDVTEARRLEERTRQAQKLEELGVLAGGIAHDFNNIVGAILANATLAQQRLLAGEPVDALLADVQTAATRAGSLAGTLLQYVGKAPTRRQTVDLVGLAQELLQLARAMVSKRVRLELRAAHGPARVVGDPAQLHQVLLNLVVNGAEAIAGDGAVVVEVGAGPVEPGREDWLPGPPGAGEYALLRVRDDGGGMDEATRRRMFDPFFTTKSHGRGLGLSAVLGIITSHDGTVRVESAPGRGTLFEVALPLAERVAAAEPATAPAAPSAPAAPAAPAAVGPEPSARTGGHVLFVDDEEMLRRIGVAILTRAGYRVTEAPDAETALARVRAAPGEHCLVVMDQNMPGMGGRRGIARLREVAPGLPVLLTSGYGPDEGEEGASFIAKPYTAGQLVAAVAEALGRARLKPA